MQKPFTKLTAIAAPIMRTNVETDVIIRIERLAGVLANGRSVRCAICLMVRRTPNSF